MKDKVFIDTNILIYIVKDNSDKSVKVADKIPDKSTISIQVVNEFSNVALKKLGFAEPDVLNCIVKFKESFNISHIYIETTVEALKLKEKYKYSYYDSLIIASALQSKCNILYSEDMQHNQLIEDRLRIINPFI